MTSTSRPFLLTGLLPLFVAPVWAAGGAYKPWQGSFLWLCLFAWGMYFLEPTRFSGITPQRRLKAVAVDPIFWCALLLMGFLTLQFLNTGRIQIFDFLNNRYTYSPPPHPGLPWSVNRIEALEMIRWFGVVLTVLLLLRHSWTTFDPRAFTWLVMLNGFLNAILAFIHLASGWEYMYNLKRFGKDVYGSFGYPNHGAVFFILLFSISMGLALKELLQDSSERNRATFLFALIWSPVFFIAANLSTSRAGILGSWMVLVFSLAHLAVIAWPRLHPVQLLYGMIGSLLLFGFFAAGFVIFAQPVHLKELQAATVELDILEEIGGRFFQVETAYDMWKDHPWYGVGGWGYRYFVSQYLPVEEWTLLAGKGKANVHNDWMQFLAEFGLIGFGLLAACFLPRVICLVKAFKLRPTNEKSLWSDPLKICAFWGLVMLLLISQFDIPLRSPGVFVHGIFLLFLLSPHPMSPSLWTPVIDWKRLQPPALRVKQEVREVIPEDPPTDW